MSIWRWAEYFSKTPVEFQITLGEGNTPLVHSRRIGPEAGLKHLYFKLESSNPTGSYKDRFGASAISDMLANRQTRCVGTSSGNAGAAMAAYCATARIACELAIIETAPPGKLKQMLAYGANVYLVRGMGVDPQVTDQVADCLRRCAARVDARLQISAFAYSPNGMAGVQTIAYELAEQAEAAGHPIDGVFIPAAGGGLTLAVARGFAQLHERGAIKVAPRIHCVQPDGNDTMVTPLREGSQEARPVQCTTQVSGLQVGCVIDGTEVIAICRVSGGTGHLVSDEAAWKLQARLATEEGIFCEPAGAVGLVGALDAADRGEIRSDEHVVCLVTGTGFKDPPSVDRMIAGRPCPTIDVGELAERISS